MDTKSKCLPVCAIIPSRIFEHIAENAPTKKQKEAAYRALSASSNLRGQRELSGNFVFAAAVAPGTKRRTIYDGQKGMNLPGKLVRSEGKPKTSDREVNEAYDGSGKTYDFFKKIFQRNSIDGNGMRLDSTVHHRIGFNNAFWNGQQMVYGDGDGDFFNKFTRSLDVIAHELTHGVTQIETNLVYSYQAGALNEHLSDVFGSLVKQNSKNQTASKADWLIGEGLFTANVQGVALRSMKAPGTAYNDPVLGKDPQPSHMSNYDPTSDDNGGVHINSGILNKAFCDFAVSLGGPAWTKAGRIWYVTLIEKVQTNTDFKAFRDMTVQVAESEFPGDKALLAKLKSAWAGVGL